VSFRVVAQTVKFYRRAVLPLPKSLTPYLDKLRETRKSDWVFVNSRGEPYTTSAFDMPVGFLLG
jgi:hypothetical protein